MLKPAISITPNKTYASVGNAVAGLMHVLTKLHFDPENGPDLKYLVVSDNGRFYPVVFPTEAQVSPLGVALAQNGIPVVRT